MVVVVTRDVPMRFRGFLASCMLEIAPGTYTAPAMSAGVRDRVWAVVNEWHADLGQGSIVMTWSDKKAAGGQQVRFLGVPPKELVAVNDVILVRRELTAVEMESLKKELSPK
jgi:CRISPR-associated protein Cas2